MQSCCDGLGYLRQREPKGHNLVVRAKNWDSAESLVKLKSNANEITRCVHTHVWFLSYHAEKFSRRCLLHSDVSEELLAGIFQAGTKQIDHIVDNQEAVVIVQASVDRNWWVLLVVALHIELLLLGELTGIDGGRNIGIAIAEHRQGINVDVVVYKNDGMLRLLDETDNLGIGIEDLPVVEDAFNRGQGCTYEEIYFVLHRS